MNRRPYLLAVLTVVLAFNYVDRVALGVMLQNIKVDLSLSDTQLGFLTGIAFAAFYATMGIPIARWADRGNRVTIIALTAGLWSVAVALCAVSKNFIQLLLIRTGVAVGEAGCYPPALSLISDHFPRAERPRAVGRYMLGFPLALFIGNFAAGWLNQIYGWRTTFVLIGAPGLLLALLAAFTLKEPRRLAGAMDSAASGQAFIAPSQPPSLGEVLRTLWFNRAFRHLWCCFSIWGFFGYGLLQWQPTFFVRSHALETGMLGTWLAVVYGGGGLLGTWLGGELASRYAANNERLQLAVMAALYVILALLNAGIYLAPTYHLAFAALGASAVAGALGNGPLFSATQTLVPPRMRAMATALIYFFCNLIGMGLGPLAVGALSDALRPAFGEDSLRFALLACSPGYFWCSWHLWRASRTVTRDVPAAEDERGLMRSHWRPNVSSV
jgi:MFS family permease